MMPFCTEPEGLTKTEFNHYNVPRSQTEDIITSLLEAGLIEEVL